MIEDLIAELETVYAEQKRLAEVEDVLQTMRSVAIEATTCSVERRVQLAVQFHELQTQLTYLETEKREPFHQSTIN